MSLIRNMWCLCTRWVSQNACIIDGVCPQEPTYCGRWPTRNGGLGSLLGHFRKCAQNWGLLKSLSAHTIKVTLTRSKYPNPNPNHKAYPYSNPSSYTLSYTLLLNHIGNGSCMCGVFVHWLARKWRQRVSYRHEQMPELQSDRSTH